MVPEISVIVITRNRPQKLLQCLQALSKSSFTNFELVIVDQSDRHIPDPDIQVHLHYFSRFHFIHARQIGKSRGLNQAIAFASSPLLAFTDDDCIPDTGWLKHIVESFASYPQVTGVFGKTIPYQREKHHGFFCPATFENKNPKAHIISEPCKHWEWVGYGNNMAFRKNVFTELGGFKEWLGPGSIGSNAEDAEIALRALLAGKVLFYNPQALIAHNRWITFQESNLHDLSYICGEISCYGFLALCGNGFARTVLKDSFREVFFAEPRYFLHLFVHLKLYVFSLSFWWVIKMFARLRGAMVAGYYFLLSYLSQVNVVINSIPS